MHLFKLIFFGLLLHCNGASVKDISPFGYHERVGIPLAKSLEQSEFEQSNRIVGGSQAVLAALPYHTGIVTTLTTGWTSICGGSLVSETRVLTAAHCWWDGQNQGRSMTIVLGSLLIFSGGTRIETTEIVVHPSWNPQEITHDIAVVKISTVTYSNNIQAVSLPAASLVNIDFSGLSGIASGYGKMTDAQTSFPTTTALYQITLPIITNAVCQNSFTITLHGSHLCTSGTGGIGTCDGDSGGPLTVVYNNQRILVGITSFGLADGCQSGYPSVFTRVTAFLTWIQANL